MEGKFQWSSPPKFVSEVRQVDALQNHSEDSNVIEINKDLCDSSNACGFHMVKGDIVQYSVND